MYTKLVVSAIVVMGYLLVCIPNTMPAQHSITSFKSYKTSPSNDTLVTIDAEGRTNVLRNISICKGEGYFAAGRPRFVSGIFRDTLLSSIGRDSIVTVVLHVSSCKLAE